MINIRGENSMLLFSDNIPYARYDVTGFQTFDAMVVTLSNPELFDLIAEKKITNLLVNFANSARFGTDDLDWIKQTWVKMLSDAGIQKLSVVAPEQVYGMFGALFVMAADEINASTSLEAHFFDPSQFYDTTESVDWF